jgi:hypothetical protein
MGRGSCAGRGRCAGKGNCSGRGIYKGRMNFLKKASCTARVRSWKRVRERRPFIVDKGDFTGEGSFGMKRGSFIIERELHDR